MRRSQASKRRCAQGGGAVGFGQVSKGMFNPNIDPVTGEPILEDTFQVTFAVVPALKPAEQQPAAATPAPAEGG